MAYSAIVRRWLFVHTFEGPQKWIQSLNRLRFCYRVLDNPPVWVQLFEMLEGFWAPLIVQYTIAGKWPTVANILCWSDGRNRFTVRPVDREQANELWVSGGTQMG
jgi:hypothetical protein